MAVMASTPAYVSLTNAAAISRFRLQPDAFGEMSQAISHGISLGFNAKTLAAMRWEEGWDKPLEQWRQDLGITAPANPRPYGLAQ